MLRQGAESKRNRGRHPMWAARSEKLDQRRGLRFVIDRDSRPATFADVLKGWRHDHTFCSVFTDILGESPFDAFRWETPPVTSSTLTRDFEFVLLDSPYLARRPDLKAFAEHFRGGMDSGVVVVPNLGGDATLIIPCPIGDPSCYGHLGAFVRGAPGWQQRAFWRAVAEAMDRR